MSVSVDMRVHDLFPETLPYDLDMGRELAQRLKSDPKNHLIQGCACQGMLALHQKQFTTVVETDEAPENRWWDGYLPELKTPIRWDSKSRLASSTSFTISKYEYEKQVTVYRGLFVWPLYKVDGNLFVRDFVLARLYGTDLIVPGTNPGKQKVHGGETMFWGLRDLDGQGVLALDLIEKMNLI